MSQKMLSRVVSVSMFTKNDFTGFVPVEGDKWIVLKWFHPSDYETQESLNDASEIFADEILKDLSSGHYIRIETCKEVMSEEGRHTGKYYYELERLELKNQI